MRVFIKCFFSRTVMGLKLNKDFDSKVSLTLKNGKVGTSKLIIVNLLKGEYEP